MLTAFTSVISCRIFYSRMANTMNTLKQLTLKPQDLVVTMKLAVIRGPSPSFAKLAKDLCMSASEVHAATNRASYAHLIERVDGDITVNKSSLQEFLLHGAKYVFPAVLGPLVRGMTTGASAPGMSDAFEHGDSLPIVWPDSQGDVRGVSLCPLYPTVPAACREDPSLYKALAAFDALRAGAAREREMAIQILKSVTA